MSTPKEFYETVCKDKFDDLKADTSDTREKVDELHKLFCGNGSVGIAERVNTLERASKNVSKLFWTATAAAISVVAYVLKDMMT